MENSKLRDPLKANFQPTIILSVNQGYSAYSVNVFLKYDDNVYLSTFVGLLKCSILWYLIFHSHIYYAQNYYVQNTFT